MHALFCPLFMAILIFGSASALNSVSLEKAIRLVQPKSLSLIQANSVRLLATVPPSCSTLREIRFYISYKTMIDSIHFPNPAFPVEYLGKAVHPPYEFIADLSRIPEQDLSLGFRIEGVTLSGKTVIPADGRVENLVLDRRPAVSNKKFTSRFIDKTLTIDGNLTDWVGTDSIGFSNGDNQIKAYSAWDKRALYFGIEVTDNTITGPYTQRGYLIGNRDMAFGFVDVKDYVPVHIYDEIELFFDKQNTKKMMRDLDDMHFLIGAKGAYYGRQFDYRGGKSFLWGQTVVCSVKVLDNPGRYVIEVAFPWTEFGFKPTAGRQIGFDLFNKDNLIAGGPSTGISWNGAEYTNYNNPSEWGVLELQGGGSGKTTMWVILALFGSLACVFVLMRRRNIRAKEEESLRTGKYDMVVKNIEKYLNENYANPELSLSDPARAVGISPKYAGSLFKSAKALSVSQYLNQIRIEKAKELLLQGELNVTEIAFKVGYNSPDHFTRVFKSFEKISPIEYKQKAPQRKT